MKPDSWNDLISLFERALGLPEGERGPFLKDACPDPELLREVHALLGEVTASQGFLDPPTTAGWTEGKADPLESFEPGARIGRYTLGSVIGRGGMGIVYEATQENPRRRIALKMMRPGTGGPDGLRRFRYEATILARLKHPGIAQVYEAGTYPVNAAGLSFEVPFFALEYIESARTILDHARAEGLSRRERIQLFQLVCRAVHYSHQQGIIHRDLKPANILVDHNGQPKVIDFGIARTENHDPTLTYKHTQTGQVLGTPQAMSPEQIEPGRTLDTRSDVYALGLVLYELLTESFAFDLENKSAHEVFQVIRDVEPTSPRRHDRTIPIDLEWILRKTLEKDPERRYSSASELDADLNRFLADTPVLAGPPSRLYQWRKFVRRNRAAVFATALALLALIVGAIGLVIGLLDAIAARTEAERARGRAETAKLAAEEARTDAEDNERRALAVTEFLQATFTAGDRRKKNPKKTVESILDDAVASLAGRFRDQPRIEMVIREIIGGAYHALGIPTKATPVLRRALELRTEISGRESDETQELVIELARTLIRNWHSGEAEQLLKEAEAYFRSQYQEEHRGVVDAREFLAMIYLNSRRIGEALEVTRRNYEVAEVLFGPDHGKTIECKSMYGATLERAGDREGSVRILREAFESATRSLGSGHPSSLAAGGRLARVLAALGRYDESLELRRDLLKGARSSLGDRHQQTLDSMYGLAVALYRIGANAEAEPVLEELIESSDAILEETDVSRYDSRILLAVVRQRQGKLDAAEVLLRETIAKLGEHFSRDVSLLPQALGYLATLRLDQGAMAEAAILFQENLELLLRVQDGAQRNVVGAMSNIGIALLGAKRPQEARDILEAALALGQVRLDPYDTVQGMSALHLARALRELGETNSYPYWILYFENIWNCRYGPGTDKAMGALEELAVFYEECGQPESVASVRSLIERRKALSGL